MSETEMNDEGRTIFSEELEAEILALKDHYPDAHAAVIPALHLIQATFGYIPDEAMIRLGEILAVPPAEVFGTLTFYTMFRRQEEGLFHINVCRNISCHLSGSTLLREHLEKRLGVKPGKTTADGIFTLGEVECLGACTEAPVLEVDSEYYFRVTPEKADRILDAHRENAASSGHTSSPRETPAFKEEPDDSEVADE
jgi:NADH-quinone oxidoreductase subunit E